MGNTSVTFKIYQQGKVQSGDEDPQNWKPPYKQGQIIFSKSEGKIYLDFYGERTCYTPSGLKYIGISDKDPLTLKPGEELPIRGISSYTPENMDVIVWENKEYMYRNNGWYEIGDEGAPTWQE